MNEDKGKDKAYFPLDLVKMTDNELEYMVCKIIGIVSDLRGGNSNAQLGIGKEAEFPYEDECQWFIDVFDEEKLDQPISDAMDDHIEVNDWREKYMNALYITLCGDKLDPISYGWRIHTANYRERLMTFVRMYEGIK